MKEPIQMDDILLKVTELRNELHEHPEISGHETNTRRRLIQFLQKNTQLEIVNMDRWFYVYQKGLVGNQTIALRADHDAIINTQGQVFHGCGHDGHSAILAGVAMVIDKYPVKDNVMLIFQHSEENGVGAKEIMNFLKDQSVDHIYGLHNFPGFETGELLLRANTFMCASMGMDIEFKGLQTHAGQPEKGINPMYAIAKLALMLEPLAQFNGFQSVIWEGHSFSNLVMTTIVSSSIGEMNNFGISPGRGKMQLTLRAATLDDLNQLYELISEKVQLLASDYQMTYQIKTFDEFPDTTNSIQEVEHLSKIFELNQQKYSYLVEPFRPSEDFGWYLKQFSGSFFGIGSGLNVPPLHNDAYEFPDEIIHQAIKAFYHIVSYECETIPS